MVRQVVSEGAIVLFLKSCVEAAVEIGSFGKQGKF
jgi:hypothetical protein